MSELDLTIIVYGEEGRRAEITLKPKIPADIRGDISQLNDWTFKLLCCLGADVKHTSNWGCAVCGEAARETHCQTMSWIHLPQPKLNVYINLICVAGGGPCHQQVIGQCGAKAILSGFPPQNETPLPMPPGVEKIPLAGSCANCLEEKTAAAGSSMRRCSACKLTR
ncbi:hypothetical protein HGRIS_007436 [Hohenbuehelia grisea]|uniref:Uncharacterized protein n=1 Tax=Hohenbuehelia grisea TaxID=104357 RepID=A0ABR3J550_9AGAR